MTTKTRDRLAVEVRLAVMSAVIPIAGYLTLLRLGALLHIPFLIRWLAAYKAMNRVSDRLDLRSRRGARP